jgi:hypothetical protein
VPYSRSIPRSSTTIMPCSSSATIFGSSWSVAFRRTISTR